MKMKQIILTVTAQLAGAEEYTDCISAEGVRHLPYNKYSGYDTKQSDSKALVMLELWGMWITPSLSLLPSSLWPRVVAPDRVLSLGRLELFDI